MSFYNRDYNAYYPTAAGNNGVAESTVRNDNAAYASASPVDLDDLFGPAEPPPFYAAAPSPAVSSAHGGMAMPQYATTTAGPTAAVHRADSVTMGSTSESPLTPASLMRQNNPHQHTDTYEKPLPPEALGARQLIEYIFTPSVPGRPHSALSPPNVTTRPRPREIGWPVPLATEPVNPSTGRRLVYFGQGLPPQLVLAEQKNRFVAVVFKPVLSAAAAAVVNAGPTMGDSNSATGYTNFGTVLGYSDDNTMIIWHDRSERFASRISIQSIHTIHRATAMKCKHCGFVLLQLERGEHMNTHKKGSGVEYGVFNDDAELGFLCGDSGLMQNLTSPRHLGEGAQGVVDLMDVVQPSRAELEQAGSSSSAYTFVSKHLSPAQRLQKVVVKTLHFANAATALAEYQKSVRFMTVMQHPHLVEYLAVQLKPDNRTVRICMPFYEEGDVSAVIRDFRGDHFQESFICSIALQLSLALAFLHERNPPIVHGDLKVENVMFYNHKEQIVLMDLDASREVMGGSQEGVHSALGTTAYMAPETLKVERLMPSSDMWSLGVFLYVMMVLPDFPMIVNPNTHNLDLLNADCWATTDELHAMESYAVSALSGGRSTTTASGVGQGNRGITLGDCVRKNITQKGFSADLAQLVVDLLSYDPLKRPEADAVGGRLTDIMTKNLLGDY